MATNLQKLGVRLEVTEAVLNHVSGSRAGIVGVYQRHEYADEKRAALDAWARRLDAIVTGARLRTSSNLRRRGRERDGEGEGEASQQASRSSGSRCARSSPRRF